jgi:DNA polymerase-3 subunit delta'
MNRHSANGLLKTLEEPQSNKLILLLSSQPSRLLPTVKSRCQNLTFTIPETSQGMAWLQTQTTEASDQQTAQRLLTLAGGAPLLALQYAEQGKLALYQQLLDSFEKLAKKQVDPVVEAKRWEAAGLAHCVKWLYLWVSSVIHLKSGANMVDTNFGDTDTKMVENNSVWREPSLDFLADKTSSESLYGFLDQLVETSRVVNTTINVQLTLESLLMGWCQRVK